MQVYVDKFDLADMTIRVQCQTVEGQLFWQSLPVCEVIRHAANGASFLKGE